MVGVIGDERINDFIVSGAKLKAASLVALEPDLGRRAGSCQLILPLGIFSIFLRSGEIFFNPTR